MAVSLLRADSMPDALPNSVFWVGSFFGCFETCLILGAFLVGAARFELTTPCPPDKCANRAAPRPDRNGADYRTVRLCCSDYRISPHVATLPLGQPARGFDLRHVGAISFGGLEQWPYRSNVMRAMTVCKREANRTLAI